MARNKSKSKSGSVTIPGMKNVQGKINITDGEHLVEVAEVSEEEGQNAPYLKWKFNIAEGGGALYYNTSLAPQALWNLRSLLEAMEIDIPDDDTDMDTDDFIGKQLMVQVDHEVYEGKSRPRIVDFWPAEQQDEPKKSKAKEDDNDKEDDAAARRKARREARKERDADADEKPAKKDDKKSSKKLKKLSEDEVDGMDADELGELVGEYKLDIDLDDFATLRKKKAAVIDALGEKELIEE